MHIAKEEEGTKRGEGGVDVANFGEVCSLRGGGGRPGALSPESIEKSNILTA